MTIISTFSAIDSDSVALTPLENTPRERLHAVLVTNGANKCRATETFAVRRRVGYAESPMYTRAVCTTAVVTPTVIGTDNFVRNTQSSSYSVTQFSMLE